MVEDITGVRPKGFRAPHLLWPHFYRSEVYAMLNAQGYHWASNRWVCYPVELFRPERLPIRGAWRAPGGRPWMARNRLMLAPLNARMVAKAKFGGSSTERLRWLLGKRPPFVQRWAGRGSGLRSARLRPIGPAEARVDTPPDTLAYTRAVVETAAATRRDLTMITFHDWIVSGGNRLALLGDALATARQSGTVISTIADNPDWLSATV